MTASSPAPGERDPRVAPIAERVSRRREFAEVIPDVERWVEDNVLTILDAHPRLSLDGVSEAVNAAASELTDETNTMRLRKLRRFIDAAARRASMTVAAPAGPLACRRDFDAPSVLRSRKGGAA